MAQDLGLRAYEFFFGVSGSEFRVEGLSREVGLSVSSLLLSSLMLGDNKFSDLRDVAIRERGGGLSVEFLV